MYTGKKLLILGATTETIFLVKKAESLGVETYVVDPYDNAPAKKYSSHPINLDCFNVDAIISLIEDNKIDGVLPGCADVLVPIYQQICSKTKRYCYVNEKITYAFGNKKGLKEILKKHNLPVIEEYSLFNISDTSFSQYPIFLKPVDNNSSKGMSVVYSTEEFFKAYQKALNNSRSKNVLIEKYMTSDDFYIGYVLKDGKAFVTFTADRFINADQKGVGSITKGLIYPSKFTELYFSAIHTKMLEVFDELGFDNGMLHIQGFVENGKIMFYDPALRITGGQEYLLLERIYGFDLLESLVSFALTGRMGCSSYFKEINCNFNGYYACNLVFSVKCAKIGRIDGVEFAKSHTNVVNVTQEHFPGDVIERAGTAQQNIIRMHLLAQSKEELINSIKELQSQVVAYDEDGNNIMLEGLDVNVLRS